MDLRNRAEASGDGHDESVLNPEMPNETDLTKKEKRRIEREKLKGMGLGKKLQYLWMYYKIYLFGAIALVGLICLGVNLYHHAQMETVLSISVVDGGDFNASNVEKNILQVLDTDNKFAEVSVAQNLTTDETGDLDYYARMAYVTEIQSATLDVLVMPKELYDIEKDKGMYANLKELFGDEVYKSLGAADEQHLEIDGGKISEEFGLGYKPVCVCLAANVKNADNALKWIRSVTE